MRKLVIAALFLSGPAFAQPAPLPANPQAITGHSSDRLICRRVNRMGTRLGSQRICATQAEWDQYRRDVRQGVDKIRRTARFRAAEPGAARATAWHRLTLPHRIATWTIDLRSMSGCIQMKKLLFLGGIVMSAAAFAQAPTAGNGGASATSDPGQMVCRTIADTGSRLSRTRICMTRAQWEDRRREARSTIERGQINRRNEGN